MKSKASGRPYASWPFVFLKAIRKPCGAVLCELAGTGTSHTHAACARRGHSVCNARAACQPSAPAPSRWQCGYASPGEYSPSASPQAPLRD